MKNSEIWNSYSNFTLDLSNNARTLAFAGAAIAWLFKTQDNTFPSIVLWGLFFIIIFFILDILQYFLGAIILKFWAEGEESKQLEETGKIDGEYDKPRYIDYPSFFCWVAKVISLLMGYICLGTYIFLK